MLLRDLAINLGVVADRAKNFADLVYNFELRIVNDVLSESYSATMSLGAIQKLAPLVCHSPYSRFTLFICSFEIQLPITDTIKTTFSNTKIDENTMVYVEDVGKLRDMSIVVSTSDYM